MCNEQITWSEGVPCEWAVPFIVLAVVSGIAIGVIIVLVLIKIYERFTEWWDDRKETKTTWTPPIQWSKNGDTARIVAELNARKHKHHYKVIRARYDRYEFVCRKDGCGDIAEIFRTYFWDGEKTVPQLYEEAIRAMRGNWQAEKFDV